MNLINGLKCTETDIRTKMITSNITSITPNKNYYCKINIIDVDNYSSVLLHLARNF